MVVVVMKGIAATGMLARERRYCGQRNWAVILAALPLDRFLCNARSGLVIAISGGWPQLDMSSKQAITKLAATREQGGRNEHCCCAARYAQRRGLGAMGHGVGVSLLSSGLRVA